MAEMLLELLLAVIGGAIGGFIFLAIMRLRIRSAFRPIYPVSWSVSTRPRKERSDG